MLFLNFQLDDDDYFNTLKSDIAAKEREKLRTEIKSKEKTRDDLLLFKELAAKANAPIADLSAMSDKNFTELETDPSQVEDHTSNKRRAENTLVEKEPTKKKSKESKKKKIIAMGGVSMFGGKDLFGGKNPFANRKQEESSEEDEGEDDEVEPEANKPENGIKGEVTSSNYNIAIQPDAEEKPVSFEDLPSNSHVISSSAKHRVTLPSKRRPPARHKIQTGNRIELVVTRGNLFEF